MDLRIVCVGYSYDFWVGPFYPKHTPQSDFLTLYGKVFDLVEIDNTFYAIPQPETTAEWRDAVPPHFLFAAKFPRVITHELEFGRAIEPTERFFRAMDRLRPKVGPLLVQLPPSLTYHRGEEKLFALLDGLPRDYRYAVEFRHGSWMHEAVFQALRKREVALVWNEVVYVDTVPEITADFVYLRFVGDRSLEKLGWIQIDRTAEMNKWAARLKGAEPHVNRAFVLFNNHFAGFGPGCVDAFRKMLDLPGVDLGAIHAPEAGQRRLGDFGPKASPQARALAGLPNLCINGIHSGKLQCWARREYQRATGPWFRKRFARPAAYVKGTPWSGLSRVEKSSYGLDGQGRSRTSWE